MALARWQATIVDDEGSVVPTASIEVRREVPGQPLVQVYSDRDGANAIGNPFQADAEGFAGFHILGGVYQIKASSGGFERIWRYVGIGTAAEFDVEDIINLIPTDPEGPWNVATTYALAQLVEHQGYLFISNEDGNLGNEPQTDPPGSDQWWTWIGTCGNKLTGSSTTALDVPTAFPDTLNFDFEQILPLGFVTGQRLRLASAADPENIWIEGVIMAYAHPSCTIEADKAKGIGQHSDWLVGLTGEPSDVAGADGIDPGYLLNFETATAAPPAAGGVRFDNADLSLATTMYVSKVNRENSSIEARLLELFNPAHTVKDVVLLVDPATDKQASFVVNGLTDQIGYVELTIGGHDGETMFPTGPISLQTDRAGADGAVSGPAGGVVAGQFAVFADTTGNVIEGTALDPNDGNFIVGDGTNWVAEGPDTARASINAEELGVARGVNAQTGTTYTFVLADAGQLVQGTNASAITFTVPPNSSVAFDVGTYINIAQGGAGAITVTPDVGVTVNNNNGLVTNGQFALATIFKTGTDTWLAGGDLTS